jgi:hypothetical protein
MNNSKKTTTKKNTFTFNEEIENWLSVKADEYNVDRNSVIESCVEQFMINSMKVDIKDYEEKVHILNLGINGVGIRCDYTTADLIHMIMECLIQKKGETDLMDMSKIKVEHDKKWRLYFKKKEEEYFDKKTKS